MVGRCPQFWLGTDAQGRDILWAILGGLRISFGIGLVTTLVALVVGTAVGLTAAAIGDLPDLLIMRAVEFQLGFPALLICIVVLGVTGRGAGNVVLALVIAQWPAYARTVHNAALAEQGKTYWSSFLAGTALICILFAINVFTDRLRGLFCLRAKE